MFELSDVEKFEQRVEKIYNTAAYTITFSDVRERAYAGVYKVKSKITPAHKDESKNTSTQLIKIASLESMLSNTFETYTEKKKEDFIPFDEL